MSKPWPMVPLGEVLTKSDELIDLKPEATYSEVTVRLWGKGVVQRREVSGAGIAAQRRSIVRAGQFILSRIDARNGAFGLIPDSLDGAVVSNDFPVFNLNPQKIDPKYLAWMSRTHAFIDLCKAASEGTTNRVRLKEDRFLAAQIPLPPLPEQKRIVARIAELAAKIEEAKGLRQKAVEEAAALLPASICKQLTMIAQQTQLGEEGLCEIICGQHLNPEEQTDSGIPYMTGPADFRERIAVPSRFTNIARALAQPGDVLLTVKGAGVGKVNLAPVIPAAIGRQLYAIRPNSQRLDQNYLFYVLQDSLRHFRDAMTATTVPGVNRNDVEKLSIPLPPLSEQHRIVAYLDDLQAKVDSLKRLKAETAAELNAMLPSVLDRAFKGEL